MEYWKVHQNIYFTKGHNRTLVFDSLLNTMKFVPNDLYDKLESNNFVITEDSLDKEYFDYLKEQNYIFQDDELVLNQFIPLEEEIEFPCDIGVCLIEVSEATGKNLGKLSGSNIRQFNFIFGHYTSKKTILNFVKFVESYEMDIVELTFTDGFLEVDYLFQQIQNINRAFVINNFLDIKVEDSYTKFKNRMISERDTKSLKIRPELLTYFESKKHNVYFYNKIFIGRNTEIKNSPEIETHFGFLNDLERLKIPELTANLDFTQYWNSIKENTLVCKDCEFKNLCSDNRIPLKNETTGHWYHNSECEYNPYISKWNEDSEYRNLKEVGVEFKDDKIILNHLKLEEINNDLWG